MVVKDVYTGGVRTFLARQDAHLFRKMLYAQASARPPGLVGVLCGGGEAGEWGLGACLMMSIQHRSRVELCRPNQDCWVLPCFPIHLPRSPACRTSCPRLPCAARCPG
jgi:hypothetical protein